MKFNASTVKIWLNLGHRLSEIVNVNRVPAKL